MRAEASHVLGIRGFAWCTAVAAVVLATGQSAHGNAPAVLTTPLPAILDATTAALPKTPTAAVEIRRGALAPGATTLWHTHPSPPFVYVESGTGVWEYRDGRPSETRHAGQAIEEPAGVVTRIANRGGTTLSLVIFQVSKPGDPVLIPAR
jgi:quercetin dioxygenase-like cupin family protein